ncbi:uncharacterized protein LOC144158527 isoform X3 [Haemaphysalis longicornis]
MSGNREVFAEEARASTRTAGGQRLYEERATDLEATVQQQTQSPLFRRQTRVNARQSEKAEARQEKRLAAAGAQDHRRQLNTPPPVCILATAAPSNAASNVSDQAPHGSCASWTTAGCMLPTRSDATTQYDVAVTTKSTACSNLGKETKATQCFPVKVSTGSQTTDLRRIRVAISRRGKESTKTEKNVRHLGCLAGALTSSVPRNVVIATPMDVAHSGHVPCNQKTQASISTGTTATQCALWFLISTSCQTELPDLEVASVQGGVDKKSQFVKEGEANCTCHCHPQPTHTASSSACRWTAGQTLFNLTGEENTTSTPNRAAAFFSPCDILCTLGKTANFLLLSLEDPASSAPPCFFSSLTSLSAVILSVVPGKRASLSLET